MGYKGKVYCYEIKFSKNFLHPYYSYYMPIPKPKGNMTSAEYMEQLSPLEKKEDNSKLERKF